MAMPTMSMRTTYVPQQKAGGWPGVRCSAKSRKGLQRSRAGGIRSAGSELSSAKEHGGELQKKQSEGGNITGVVFDPLAEVQAELNDVEAALDTMQGRTPSLARSNYAEDLEAAVNYQINAELNFSYVYTAMSAFFDRDDVGLPGFAKYFGEQSKDEREHAEMLIEHQNRRGGRVALATIVAPSLSDFHNDDRGDALWAMELSLAMEKLNFTKLRELHALADHHHDPEMSHFLEDYLLHNQAKEIKRAANHVSMLRRVGKGHGTWHFDRYLYSYGDSGNGHVAALGG